MSIYDEVTECFNQIKEKMPFTPKLALVLGSGLGKFADNLDIKCIINYKEIDGLAVATAPGHRGRFVFAYINEVPVVIMQGRLHYYEGYSVKNVVLPIRLVRLMGAEILFLTNAAGGINLSFKVGDFMLIRDHISFLIPSCLIGPNDDTFGPRFPDMTTVYNESLASAIMQAAKQENIDLKSGVYLQIGGPNYETPAEIRAFRILGADAVGMSTTIEAQCANYLGMKVCGISCISNMAAGITTEKLSGDDVNKAAKSVGGIFSSLIHASIKNISEIL